MTLPELLAEVARVGVRLEAHGDRLRFHPRARVTPALAEGLRLHKLAMLAALAEPPGPCPVCRSAIVVRTAAGPVVCPGCCPGVTGDRLVWRDDLGQWCDYATERAAAEALRAERAERFMARVAQGAARPDPVRTWDGRGEPAWERDGRAADLVRDDGPRCLCGSVTYRDVPIHDGRSLRRDCARCGRFLDFVVWYGQERTHRTAPGERDGRVMGPTRWTVAGRTREARGLDRKTLHSVA